MPDLAPSTRRYRGAAPDERRAQRRGQIIRAALQVYGERGYRAATVKSVCDAAGLTERYFYESFANSEALLAACLGTVTDWIFDALAAAGQDLPPDRPLEQLHAKLMAYFEALRADPRSARLFLLEVRGVSAEVDQTFEEVLRAYGDAIVRLLLPTDQDRPDELLVAGVVGGVMHIALRWMDEGFEAPVQRVADGALMLCRALLPTGRARDLGGQS